MIDATTALSFSMASSPGRYALLLGSGVSRSAAIKTGWEITLDLIQQLAASQGEKLTEERDLLAWYRGKFSKEPDYSEILEMLAPNPDDRHAMLRSYFEPSDDDRDNGRKVPTKVHHAIARLIADGVVRVVLTTNFDRLLEHALAEIGIHADVVSTADGVAGAVPIVHSPHRIIKLHGDYLDTRIKNTADELEAYDPRIVDLLDRVLDEFGLIVCGWSAEWDTALVAAVERAPNRRYPMYWVTVGGLRPSAQKLVDLRKAKVVNTAGAEAFFPELTDKVEAIRDARKPHPVEGAVAVEMVKKFVVDPMHRIRLHDLVMGEVDKLRQSMFGEEFPLNVAITTKLAPERVTRYEALSTTLSAMMLNGAYWGDEHHDGTWAKAVIRLASVPTPSEQYNHGVYKMQIYPAILVTYAIALSAVARSRFGILGRLATAEVDDLAYRKPFFSVITFTRLQILERSWPAYDLQFDMPMSERMYQNFLEPCRLIVANERQYEDIFDAAEYLLALLTLWQTRKTGQFDYHLGCFARRGRRVGGEGNRGVRMIKTMLESSESAGTILQTGLFDASLDNAKDIMSEVDKSLLPWGI